jgi:beta-glucosidase
MARDIDALIAGLTLDEKAALTAGVTAWSTAAVERAGIPSVVVSDGPAGARGPLIPGVGKQVATLCIPCGSALGATWDPDLVEQLGVALGRQARSKAARVLLAPTVNMHRSPLAGRNFECFSEDPLLAGRLAAAYVRGVQSQGVATTVKHFAGNDAEFERTTINSVIDERTLREIYLRPFEMAVREGGSLGIMTAYNRLNGVYCAEHAELLGILRDEWGFEGFVVTDWYAAGSTAGSATAGLDLEMPAPARFYGRHLGQAVGQGDVDEKLLDAAVRRLLTVFDRLGALDDPPQEPAALDRPEDRALARTAAISAMVLLKNDAVLPLDPSTLRTVALIGPNAVQARIMGGGSAEVLPHHQRSPLEALVGRLGDSVRVVHEAGCSIDRTVPVLPAERTRAADGRPGFAIDVFEGPDFQGAPIATTHTADGRVLIVAMEIPELPRQPFSFRATTTLTPIETGTHVLSLIQLGNARVLLDGAVVIDGIESPPPPGLAYFGNGSEEVAVPIELEQGRAYELVVEYVRGAKGWLYGAQIGFGRPEPADAMERAVAAAAETDVAIVVVGTNEDWESEGHDRTTLDLPGRQAELIGRVAKANARTIVAVNTGAPVDFGWIDDVPAAVQIWFGGQEMADALVDVLLGEAEPSGRLPTSVPVRLEDNPSFGNFPGANGEVRYEEGVFVGYRGYEHRGIAPRFAFGHGGSYTSFTIAAPEIDSTVGAGDPVTVRVPVTNMGERRGAEVVQCYVSPGTSAVARPAKELQAFRKVWLDPGESVDVEFVLTARAFAYWHTEPERRGWRVDPGEYTIHVARSAADVVHSVAIGLTGTPLMVDG